MLLPLLLGCSVHTLTTVEATLPADDLTALRFDVAAGDAYFAADPGTNQIYAQVTVGAMTGPGGDGCPVLDALVFVLEERDGEAVLTVDFEGPNHHGGWADVTVYAPPHLLLTGEDGSGDLSIQGFDDVDVVDGSGDTWIHQIGNNVVVNDTSGDLLIEAVDGSVTVTDTSGDIRVYGVEGDVDIDDESGDIKGEIYLG